MADLVVQIAIYGALAGGNENDSQAVDVTKALQVAIDSPQNQGIVTINNANMGGDPSPNNVKSFGAVVALDGVAQYFACQENQTIDFFHTGAAATASAG